MLGRTFFPLLPKRAAGRRRLLCGKKVLIAIQTLLLKMR
jgi:hypothetical protein